jgi:hypothetical protein
VTRLIKRLLIDILGFTLIVAGLLFGWLPGPGGIPLILAGLGLLAIHNQWARNLLDEFEDRIRELSHKIFEASPKAQIALDVLAIAIVTLGALILIDVSGLIKNIGWGLIITAIFLLLVNRRRALRAWRKITRKA